MGRHPVPGQRRKELSALASLRKWHDMTSDGVGQTVRQALLTALSGVLAFVLDASVLWVLAKVVGMHYLAAATAGMVAGVSLQYGVSRGMIFPHTGRPVAVEVLLFLLVFAIGVGLNNAIMYLLVERYEVGLLPAKLGATGLVFVANFILRKWVVFRPVRG